MVFDVIKLKWIMIWRSIGWVLVSVVVVLSLVPVPDNLPEIPSGDKIGHLIAYFVVMSWFMLCHQQRLRLVIGLMGLGVLMEVLQGFSGYRQFDWGDILANSSGVILALPLLKTPFIHSLHYFEKRILAIA